MEFSYNKQNGSLKICMPPELDECCVTDMRSDADLLIDTYQVRHLIFDFSNTVFMDSSGVGMLIGRCKQMHYRTGTSKAIHVNDRVRKIFRLSGLEHMIAIEEEEEDHE